MPNDDLQPTPAPLGERERQEREMTNAGLSQSTIPKVANTFRVGSKYRVQMTIHGNGRIDAEWVPSFPKSLSPREWRDYRSGRDNLVAELSRLIGGSILVAEV